MRDELLDLYYRATETMSESRARANLAIVQNLSDLLEKFPDHSLNEILSTFHFINGTDIFSKWKDIIFVDPEKTLRQVERMRRYRRA